MTIRVGDRVKRADGLHAFTGTVIRVGGGPRGNIVRVVWEDHTGIYIPGALVISTEFETDATAETLHYANDVTPLHP